MQAASIAILILCLITAVLFAYDKHCAVHVMWRIPEKMLLLMAAAGGAAGALVAMYLFHHKTHKPQFAEGIPVLICIQTVLLIVIANIFL